MAANVDALMGLQVAAKRPRLGWVVLGWVGLIWVVLGWVGLVWAGLCCVGLGCLVLHEKKGIRTRPT